MPVSDLFNQGSRLQIEFTSGDEPIIPMILMSLIVIDRDFAVANHLEPIALNHDRRSLIDADAEQFGVGIADVD